MRATLMHNPTSGHDSPSADELLEALRQEGIEAAYQSTDESGYETALDDPGELVIVAGGDGTVDKISRFLVGRPVPIAVLPLGTANNIAHSLGRGGEAFDLIRELETGRTHQRDVGVARGPWGEAYFFEMAGAGLFPRTMPRIDERKDAADGELRDARSELCYDLRSYLAAARELRPVRWHIALDGEDASGEYLMVEAMNIGAIGPHVLLAPDADPSDGLLDVVLAAEEHRQHLLDYLSARMEGRLARLDLPVRRAKSVSLEWGGTEFHLDSNLWSDPRRTGESDEVTEERAPSMIQLSVLPQALTFLRC